MAGKAGRVAHIMRGVMQCRSLHMACDSYDAETQKEGCNEGQDSGFCSGLNQCGHGGISFAPLTRGGIDERRAGLLAPAFPRILHLSGIWQGLAAYSRGGG